MAFCVNCGKKLVPGAKFCFECGAPVGKAAEDARKTVFRGEVHKCPSCGEILQSMTAVCPSCGHEITSAKLSPALRTFIAEINRCDRMIANSSKTDLSPQKGWKAWGTLKRFSWVILNIIASFVPVLIRLAWPYFQPLLGSYAAPKLSSAEQQKVALIENFTFPNDRESVLEALLFIKSKVAFLTSEKVNVKNVFWLRIWNMKATQLRQKANILLNNDAIAEKAYRDIVASKRIVRRKLLKHAGIFATLIGLYIAFVVSNGSLYNGISKLIPGSRFEWLEAGLSTKIPTIDAKNGHIFENNDTDLRLRLEGVTYNQFEKYVASCREMGYSVNPEKDTHRYKARNGEGCLLEVSCIGDDLYIDLQAPLVGDENFEWPSHSFASLVPQLKEKTGIVKTETEEMLTIILCDVSVEEVTDYIASCESFGFTIDAESKDTSFHGYNSDGYELSITHDEMEEMKITIEAPMELDKISWPTSGPAALIPKPSSSIGKISYDYERTFSAYIGDMPLEEFNSYIERCIEIGFEKDSRSEHYFSADKGDNISMRIEYVGFYTVSIYVHVSPKH